MLFNSYGFVFLFLPLALLGYFLARRLPGKDSGLVYLGLASLVFYGWWSLPATGVLVGSLVVNFQLARWLDGRRARGDQRGAFRLLVLGVAANIGTLVFFKYTNFLIDIGNAAAGASWRHFDILMPL